MIDLVSKSSLDKMTRGVKISSLLLSTMAYQAQQSLDLLKSMNGDNASDTVEIKDFSDIIKEITKSIDRLENLSTADKQGKLLVNLDSQHVPVVESRAVIDTTTPIVKVDHVSQEVDFDRVATLLQNLVVYLQDCSAEQLKMLHQYSDIVRTRNLDLNEQVRQILMKLEENTDELYRRHDEAVESRSLDEVCEVMDSIANTERDIQAEMSSLVDKIFGDAPSKRSLAGHSDSQYSPMTNNISKLDSGRKY